MRYTIILRIVVLLLTLAIASCGVCRTGVVNISPQSVAADHNAPAPGNSAAFTAWGSGAGDGCASTASNLGNVVWSVSDMANVSISNAQDSTYGVATCLGATSGTVTVTATLPADKNHGKTISGSGQLTCN